MFYHSIISDWNHGNAHFLRGVVSELMYRGHDVSVYEPGNGWSLQNLIKEKGDIVLRKFLKKYPHLQSTSYEIDQLDLDLVLAWADLVIVHEWNGHDLVSKISEHRKKNNHYRLLFHDTHHRSVTEGNVMQSYDLSGFDGVLAYGAKIRDIYISKGWTKRAWVWHEAADVRIFSPLESPDKEGDVVWIGNWGDDERKEEIREFLIEPVKRLRLKATVYGVRYPEEALQLLKDAGIRYGGWLPNFEVPAVFSRYRMTVHIPRRPYVTALPGIPTIRPFEALACGIPLISAPWDDCDHLFSPGKDFLFARDTDEMTTRMQFLLDKPKLAKEMAEQGRSTIMKYHTCGHRIDQLLDICSKELGIDTGPPYSTLYAKEKARQWAAEKSFRTEKQAKSTPFHADNF